MWVLESKQTHIHGFNLIKQDFDNITAGVSPNRVNQTNLINFIPQLYSFRSVTSWF